MKVLELFAGTRSIGKAFEARGHEVFSVDWDKRFENINLHADIGTLTAQDILEKFGKPDVIWASPDCATYSILAMSKHRRKNPQTGALEPATEYAAFCDTVNQHVIELIRELQPRFWFIENPRGGMRHMPWMRDLPRYTVTYCQYGEHRMKPTDIWTNHPAPAFKPPCKNGDPCHDRAPRHKNERLIKESGADIEIGGTRMMKKGPGRAAIPPELCEHIVHICEAYHDRTPQAEERVLDAGFEGVVLLVDYSYDDALIGVTTDGRAVYDFDKMVDWLMNTEGMTEEDARDWIDYNTIRALGYAGPEAPLGMYSLEVPTK